MKNCEFFFFILEVTIRDFQSRRMDVSAGLQYILEFKEVFSNGSEEIVLLKGEFKQSECSRTNSKSH